MSRASNRASTIAACVAILLLVILLVVLWTTVRSTRNLEERERYFTRVYEPSTFNKKPQLHLHDEIYTSSKVNSTNEVLPEEKERRRAYDDNILDILPSGKGDLEYIKPMKLGYSRYEDPPDEESSAERFDTGHFRHSKAEIWDPHPQYEFTAFGRRFLLKLAHDSSFISPGLRVTHISANSSRREHPGHQLGCFYSGVVDGDPASVVTVSLCHGMTGHMRTSSGSYIIKPTERWRDADDFVVLSTIEHAISRAPTHSPASKHDGEKDDGEKDEPRGRSCGVIGYDIKEVPASLIKNNSAIAIYVGERRRERRSLTVKTSVEQSREDLQEHVGKTYEQLLGRREGNNLLRNEYHYDRYYSVERGQNYAEEEYELDSEMESDPFVTGRIPRGLPREYFIEIAVVADPEMVKYHGAGFVDYILVLMSTVSRIYKHHSIGNPISISVVDIMTSNQVFGERNSGGYGISPTDMLKQFCIWQDKNNPKEPSPQHYDVAVLLTRENLCHSSEKRCDTLGLAELGKMCYSGSSCAIVQDNGLAAAFTIAHELGHVLSMPHDDDPNCAPFRSTLEAYNVMYKTLNDKASPWEWSRCSRYYVTEFLEAGHGDCLLDQPSTAMRRSDFDRLPGEDYNPDKQCELIYGPGSTVCRHKSVCRSLWCVRPRAPENEKCHTQYTPWADGTICGPGMWCQQRRCVPKVSLKPVHGEWGQWGHYGACSRTCGGGIKRKYRECNNPTPQDGGNYCVGERVRYRSCGTKECPSGSPDFREQQCAKYNNNNFNYPNVSENVKWHATYSGIPPEERCRLHCHTDSKQYFMLLNKVIDGTPCGPDTFHICVNGHCKPAGCDHVLYSTAELDTCGVCRGDNSTCQRITGSYNSTVGYGYTTITKIPAGSSYIDIRQRGWMDAVNDSSYLALKLEENGDYILNGNNMVMLKKVIVHSAVTIEYSGPEPIIERLNSSRPTSVDLVLEILSTNMYPPQITYEYTVPKKILDSYTWVLSDWSACNAMCQGVKYRKAECRSTIRKDVISDGYCRAEEKPQEKSQLCNTHCNLQWQIKSVSECSSHCGPGTRNVTSHCVQLSRLHPVRPVPDHVCSHIERPKKFEACLGPCKDVHWSYGEWGACSVTCGGGIQLRSAICVDINDREVSDESCVGQEKHVAKECAQEICPSWAFGEWGECSVSCGIGERERRYYCHVENRVVSSSDCDATAEPTASQTKERCDAGPCFEWHAGNWSSCSATCGEGTRRRKVVCRGTDGSTSGKCPPSEKPEDTSACALKPCPTVAPSFYTPDQPHDISYPQYNEIDSNGITFRSGYNWQILSYGKCSKSCNGGVMKRIVKCVSTETGAYASDDYCDAERRPVTTITCNRHPCPTMWNTGDWSQCNVACGSGFQHRQVRCQSSRGEDRPEQECSADKKPPHVKECQGTSCSINEDSETTIVRRWRVSNWSACSKSCGGGIKRRRVECTMSRGRHGPEVPVNDEQCTKLAGLSKKPRSQRQCQRVPCDFTWQEGSWSECSEKCGEGVQRRTVTCHRVNRYGWVDPEPTDGCQMNQMPSNRQVCKLRECGDEYHWTTGNWKKCSFPCGRKGRQVRNLYCHDKRGNEVPRWKCPARFRPQKRRKCNQRRCGPLNCLEAQKRTKSNRDGEYTLVIGGKSMSIYCHGMSTHEPREYLTLPAGDRENYAEMYDKSLRNPRTCPFNGQRNDSCNCETNRFGVSGLTTFRMVRIDPVKLYIIANDYTFSRTRGAKRVEFGKAGDCYSLLKCPQGRFSINLSGTHFKLSPDVTWHTSTSKAFHVVKRIDNQRVVGKCGGFCGFCVPKPGLKLDVLPP